MRIAEVMIRAVRVTSPDASLQGAARLDARREPIVDDWRPLPWARQLLSAR